MIVTSQLIRPRHLQQRSLDDWLGYQESLGKRPIDLGLERVSRVWKNMGALRFKCPVVVIGGTNGKGSTVQFISQVYQQAGYVAAAYTSPHIERYNERITVNGSPLSDETLINAFEVIEKARDEIALTYFEFGTLAALWCFYQLQPDIVFLEVGLGGRLDAVNILPHDIAIVTNVSFDHMEWLGNTLEEIAHEKAGIARPGKPLVYAEQPIPQSLVKHCVSVGAELVAAGVAYKYHIHSNTWDFQSNYGMLHDLPRPNLPGNHQVANCAAAVYVIQNLAHRLDIQRPHIETALQIIDLPGRFQKIAMRPDIILDVAHNEAATGALSRNLDNLETNEVLAVFALQCNRDIASVTGCLTTQISRWYVFPLKSIDSHDPGDIRDVLKRLSPDIPVTICKDVADAIERSRIDAGDKSTICVFGSFFVVSEAIRVLSV